MGIFKNLFGDWFGNDGPEINPANGLPMMDDSGIDIEGNPFGTDSNDFGNSDIFSDDGSNNSGFGDDDF